MRRLILIVISLSLLTLSTTAQSDTARVFTDDKPLVYVDADNLWPYSFINEHGEPEGFNIDLLRVLMKELGIPYIIRLKSPTQAMEDLKERKADLTLGLKAQFNDEYGQYGHTTVVLFTQSVATPESQPVAIKTFHDLSNSDLQITVCSRSVCYDLMKDYGWSGHAIPSDNMKESLQRISSSQEGLMVCNTLSLKWLVKNLNIDNVEITPVNMAHMEYKFMSNDTRLLARIDKAYKQLYIDYKITPIEKKWLFPDRQHHATPAWLWIVNVAGLLLLVLAALYTIRLVRENTRQRSVNSKLKNNLREITDDRHLRVWTYNVEREQYYWHRANGKVDNSYSADEFAKRYSKEDYRKLKEALNRLINRHKDAKGHEEEKTTVELQAKDPDLYDSKLNYYVIELSVLQRDASGNPKLIVAVKKDVTIGHNKKTLEALRSLRYWSMFYSDESGIIQFDSDGIIQNANTKACQLLGFDIDKQVKNRTHICDMMGINRDDLKYINNYQGQLDTNDWQVEFTIKNALDSDGSLIGYFVFCI
jgi:PAS domain-containing protein